ncbi:hypothetical protein ABZ362_00450 [Streptomyces sp. NPDC005951]|uniref:hypothetical protein n=1 Tax=Streptomyces sp. NPDC005951 TaxID=3154573 RepID=UPI0033C65078
MPVIAAVLALGKGRRDTVDPSGDGISSVSRNGARTARTASPTAGSAGRRGPPNEAKTPPGRTSSAMRGHLPSGWVQCSEAAA